MLLICHSRAYRVRKKMERIDFLKQFSERLNISLHKAGYTSTRSAKIGINLKQLAKMSGVSYQMARKYALGMALPDYHVIPKIATWLNVSPSWLLFGEQGTTPPDQNVTPVTSCIEIERELLQYILHQCFFLFAETTETDKIIHYIVDVIYDVSHLNTDNKMILKIIDMMLSSAVRFNQIQLVNIHSKEKRA